MARTTLIWRFQEQQVDVQQSSRFLPRKKSPQNTYVSDLTPTSPTRPTWGEVLRTSPWSLLPFRGCPQPRRNAEKHRAQEIQARRVVREKLIPGRKLLGTIPGECLEDSRNTPKYAKMNPEGKQTPVMTSSLPRQQQRLFPIILPIDRPAPPPFPSTRGNALRSLCSRRHITLSLSLAAFLPLLPEHRRWRRQPRRRRCSHRQPLCRQRPRRGQPP